VFSAGHLFGFALPARCREGWVFIGVSDLEELRLRKHRGTGYRALQYLTAENLRWLSREFRRQNEYPDSSKRRKPVATGRTVELIPGDLAPVEFINASRPWIGATLAENER
jgi:hypothetical protein